MPCNLSLCDLVRSKDGSLSLTKVAAATAHFLMAGGFVCLTVKKGFIPELWMIYSASALGHAAYDKSVAMIKDYRERNPNS